MEEKFQLELANRELQIEASSLAEMTNGSALVQYGDTLILATCVMSKSKKEDLGFFPLTVDYEERYYAAGKIRGARYIRREGRPTDEAILVARLIDRSIRPRFPENLNQEIQVVLTCLSWDSENDPDIIGLIAASLVLSISDIPWSGPIAAVRVGRQNNQFILNPTYKEREGNQLDLVISGTLFNEDILINMLEGNMEEISEETLLEAFEFAKPHLKKLCDFQKEISNKIGKEKISIEPAKKDLNLEKEITKFLGDKLEKSIYQKNKPERTAQLNKLKEELSFFIEKEHKQIEKIKYALSFFDKEINRIIREAIIKNGKRSDGRKLDEIREINIRVGLLPRTHGSGLFCRGQTKSLSILTLGAPGDQQLLEGMEIVGKKRFMHHYNFPPYSVGEVRPMRGPGRRDIGHGMLAEKALLPLIPSFEEFPYTIRIVSEIISSNGSTSMASISSSSLALMDAGVPIKKAAAGIAIGLMSDDSGNYKVLADIQGPEDHHGDMDFKVAGTKEGITAIQMDVKIQGINAEIFKEALSLGKKIRLQILEKIEKALAKPRPQLSPFAPRILTLQINPEKIRDVIGPGGKIINEIIAQTQANIDIEQSGLIFITSEKKEAAEKALAWIKDITREVQVGETFQGKVKRILDFGAFVEILPGQEGLVHVSQLP
ncbi:MAG: polyribonucleotide nucleotidyltransferase, partial [Patescibacteria group bacterium]